MNTPTEVKATSDPRLGGIDLDRSWQLATAAAAGWLGVGTLGVWDVVGDERGAGSPYLLFSIVLMLSAALTVAAAWSCTQSADRGTLRRWGLGVAIVAVTSTFVAWAGPLWMTTTAIGLAVLAVAAPDMRPGLAGIVVGQIAGIVVTVGAIAAEFGRQDSYGDYPAAFGLGVVVAAAGSVFGLTLLARTARAAKVRR